MLVPSPEILVKKTLAFEEFQSNFGKSSVSSGEDVEVSPGDKSAGSGSSAFPVSLRFSAGPAAEALCSGAADTGFLGVRVSGLALALPVSAATALADMFEDEVFPPPFPMNVTVEKLAFKVSEHTIENKWLCQFTPAERVHTLIQSNFYIVPISITLYCILCFYRR